MYLETINGPQDIKKLGNEQLPILAGEVRTALIEKLSQTGGHVGSNLGVVELTVALHRIFDSPRDKIIWDVSHQCYAHKILTGRRQAFMDPDHFRDVTGFTNPHESEHDWFTVGHTATSISMAMGMAAARDTQGGKENIIAVIGDGALGGGEAYEGLNTAGEYDSNLIIILNDNDQSVAENHGGLYRILRKLRESGGNSEQNFFKGLDLDYRYLENGHDIDALTALFTDVKDIDHPIVLHIHTTKGKGLAYAEEDKENWHSGSPFRIEDGVPKNGYPVYDTTVYDSLVDLMKKDRRAIVLTAGTPRAMGFVGEDRAEWERKGRFIDVGIAEENAMAMASGIARGGGTAVFGVYAPFLQRAYDQVSHDLCLNNNHATILVLLPGAYGMKSNTHFGLCDIQMLAHVPNLVYLAPSSKEEYLQMFRYATTQRRHPTAIRVPVRIIEDGAPDNTDYSRLDRFKVLSRGKGIALIAVGALIPIAKATAQEYRKATGRDITLINPCFLSGIDKELLDELKRDHSFVITLEDGVLDGGFGERIASYYGPTKMRVKNLGISKAFHSDFNAERLLAENGISVERLLELIRCFDKGGDIA